MAKRKRKSQKSAANKKSKAKKNSKAQPTITGLQRRFLAAYRLCGNITRAAECSKVSRQRHYVWSAEQSERGQRYRSAFDLADEEAIERLESEARRRAEQGTEKPVFYQGEQCGIVREYSDTLLIFLLKAARPAKYRDRYDVTVRKPDEELDRELAAALAELAARPQAGFIGESQSEAGFTEAGADVELVPTQAMADTAIVPQLPGV